MIRKFDFKNCGEGTLLTNFQLYIDTPIDLFKKKNII